MLGLRVNRYLGAIGLPHVCSDILGKLSDLDTMVVVYSLYEEGQLRHVDSVGGWFFSTAIGGRLNNPGHKVPVRIP